MAAAALVALADGDASLDEGAEVGRLLRVLGALRDHDPGVGVERYLYYVDLIRQGGDGPGRARAAVLAAAGDSETATLIVGVCQAISEADGIVRPSEVAEINVIAGMLKVKLNQAEAIMFSENGTETIR